MCLFLGIPIGTDVRNVRLAREVELPERQTFGTWEVARSGCSTSRQCDRFRLGRFNSTKQGHWKETPDAIALGRNQSHNRFLSLRKPLLWHPGQGGSKGGWFLRDAVILVLALP